MENDHERFGYCECVECEKKRLYARFLRGDLDVQFGDDLLHEDFKASQSSRIIEPIRQPVRKHGANRRNGSIPNDAA